MKPTGYHGFGALIAWWRSRRPTVTQVRVWRFTDVKTRVLIGLLVALSTTIAAFIYMSLAMVMWHGKLYPNDFFALWSWSKLIHQATYPLEIYNPAVVSAFLHGVDHSFTGAYPFAYPPSFLLVIWPLALLPRAFSYVLWVTVTLAAYVLASWDRRFARHIPIIALVAPISVLVVVAGQNGFLTAALMLAGWRLIPSRPILGGVLLGLLSFKPQLGVLIPVALIAAGLWRPFVAAATTVLLSVLASAAAFGWAMWSAWLHALLGLSYYVEGNARLDHVMVTVAGSLRLMGMGPNPSYAAQIIATIAVALLVWRCFRRRFGRMSVAVLLVATFFATPYAFFYDLPIVTNAVLLLMLDRYSSDQGFTTGEVAVLVAGLVFPLLMIATTAPLPISLVALSALLVLTARRALSGDAEPAAIPAAVVPASG